jgi:16S rRNA (adenine1518-N6/adenine1519-N6)-dimethyltransferase
VPPTSNGSSWPRRADPLAIGGVPRNASEVRARLAELGLTPSRRFGQSFLTDPFVADIEAALVEVPAGTPVVEIGGGLGLLTEALLRRGVAPLTVVERDRRLAAHLARTFGDRIRLLQGDALEVDLGAPGAVAGNLPFSVASPILTRLLSARVPLIVALLQKEVGARYAAGAGDTGYGRPALQAALYGSVERFAPVPARSFEPVPLVDGLIVRFRARPGPLPVPSVALYERTVRELFARRRKQLGNLLPRVAGGEAEAFALARSAGWPAGWERQRPEDIAPAAYFALVRELARSPKLSAVDEA